MKLEMAKKLKTPIKARCERMQAEIDEILNRCSEQEDEGGSRWPGMTYEQGVSAALRWVTKETDMYPLE